jgi:hypothetical protein
MTIHKHSFDRFKRNYRLYYKKEVEVLQYKGDHIRIEGYSEKMHIRTACQMADFFAYRIKNNIPCTKEFSYDDFDFMQRGIEAVRMSRKCIALLLGVSSFTFCMFYADNKDVKEAYYQTLTKKGKNRAKKIRWKGRSLTAKEWASRLGMTTMNFRKRKTLHGDCDLTFMSKEEYRNVPYEIRKNAINPNKKKKKAGYVDNDPKSVTHIRDLVISQEAAVLLIAALIEDSKDNMRKGRDNINEKYRRKCFFYDSQRFLQNRAGLLKYYLDAMPGINTKTALKELKEYAEFGYLTDVH